MNPKFYGWKVGGDYNAVPKWNSPATIYGK